MKSVADLLNLAEARLMHAIGNLEIKINEISNTNYNNLDFQIKKLNEKLDTYIELNKELLKKIDEEK